MIGLCSDDLDGILRRNSVSWKFQTTKKRFLSSTLKRSKVPTINQIAHPFTIEMKSKAERLYHIGQNLPVSIVYGKYLIRSSVLEA